MGEYRIVCKSSEGSYYDDTYTVQKKSWLGFWYSFAVVYYQMDRAKYAIDRDRTKITKTYENY